MTSCDDIWRLLVSLSDSSHASTWITSVSRGIHTHTISAESTSHCMLPLRCFEGCSVVRCRCWTQRPQWPALPPMTSLTSLSQALAVPQGGGWASTLRWRLSWRAQKGPPDPATKPTAPFTAPQPPPSVPAMWRARRCFLGLGKPFLWPPPAPSSFFPSLDLSFPICRIKDCTVSLIP